MSFKDLNKIFCDFQKIPLIRPISQTQFNASRSVKAEKVKAVVLSCVLLVIFQLKQYFVSGRLYSNSDTYTYTFNELRNDNMDTTTHTPGQMLLAQDSVLLTSESIGEISDALSKAQSEITMSEKDGINTFFKNSTYSTLSSSFRASKKATSKYGLAVIQASGFTEGQVTVVTLLTHKSNQWIKNILRLPIQKIDIHTIKSTVTYGRRIGYDGVLGIAPGDDEDDGNAGASQGSAEDILNQKEMKKLRAKMNKVFKECKTMDDLENKARDFKADTYGFWEKATFVSQGETFGKLYLTHKDRLGNEEVRYSKEGHDNWKEILRKVDAGNFHNYLSNYRSDSKRHTDENDIALQEHAQALGLWDEHTGAFIEGEAE